jgi:hypothetical protein
MNKIYSLLFLFLLTTITACKKGADDTKPENKYAGTWRADMGIYNSYSNGVFLGADTTHLTTYLLTLKNDDTGSTTVSGHLLTTFSYTVVGDQINYTHFVYYGGSDPNGVPDHDYSEKILSFTGTKLVTSLMQGEDINNIYFTKVN